MKIVIDIKEDLHDKIIYHSSFITAADREHMLNAIENGKILPKGHDRLIDVKSFNNYLLSRDLSFQKLLNDIPTVVEADEE